MKHSLIITGLIVAFTLPLYAQSESTFSYSEESAPLVDYYHPYVTGIPGTYDVCMRILNDELVAKNTQILGVRVPVVDSQNVKNYKLWIAKEIVPPGGFNDGDFFTADTETIEVTPVDGWIEARFSEPYTLTADGVYIGYTFESTVGNENIFRCTDGGTDLSFFLRCNTQAYNWRDYSTTSFKKTSAITAIITGDYVAESADVAFVKDSFALPNQPEATPVTIVNRGSASIQSIGYSFTMDGKTTEGSYTFEQPINNIPGTEATFPVTFPTGSDLGSSEVEFTLHTINGNANASTKNVYKSHASVVEYKPRHYPVVEDYTGMWCTYCVLGIAGMEYMNREIDGFIGVAIHYDDMLEVSKNYPYGNTIPTAKTYPQFELDRTSVHNVSSMYNPFEIEDEYYARMDEFAAASINMEAEWNDDASAITLNTVTNFVLVPYDGYTYRVNYYLLGDELSAEDPFDERWAQVNSLAGSDPEYVHPDLRDYCGYGATIVGMSYNDALLYSAANFGVEGSLPAEIERDVDYEHSYTINIDDCTGINSEGLTMVQDKNMLSAIAMVVKEQGYRSEIVNACKILIPSPTAVKDLDAANATVTSTRYYDLSGAALSNPAEGGVYIRVDEMSNGARRSTKILKK